MASIFEAADIPELTKLARDLYLTCNSISGDAPDGFNQLVASLESLHSVFQTLKDDVSSSKIELSESDEECKHTLHRCLNSCSGTLQQLKEVVDMYRNLGFENGRQLWQSIDWMTQQAFIDDLKSKIVAHTCHLGVCVGSLTKPSIERSESSATKDSANNIPLPTPASWQAHDDVSPISISVSTPRQQNVFILAELEGTQPSRSNPAAPQSACPPEDPSHVSASSESVVSGHSDTSSFTATTYTSPTSPATSTYSPSQSVVPEVFSTEKEVVWSRGPGSGFSAIQHQGRIQRSTSIKPGESTPWGSPGHSGADAIQELHRRQLREQLFRSLRCEPRDKMHQPDAELLASFDHIAHKEERAQQLTARCWLLVAVWWLLKAKQTKSLKEDFGQFSAVDVPDYAAIHSQNLDFWEPIQPEEMIGKDGQPAKPGNFCYITVELEDAGKEDEQVLFRTFVNAGIGAKKLRMRSRGAPYMLLLSTKYGESEPKISLCNQYGTFCLQRDLTPGDLAQLIQVSNASLTDLSVPKPTEPLTLKFDAMTLSISFQYMSDIMQVISMPKAYFDAVQIREPLDSDQFTEKVIFKIPAESVEQLRMPSMVSTSPPTVHRSCEVRILERSFGEAWRSIRRMVISSSIADKPGQATELFMPLSHVQVSRTTASGFILLKWSDTGQERSSKTDGNYHPLFTYVYDGSNPNIGLGIQFRSQEAADNLERAVLGLSQKPAFTWSQAKSSGQVYEVADIAPDEKRYKAVMICRTRAEWKQCSLHYLFRDMDYLYDHSSLRVRFPRALFATYISSHVDQLYRADGRVFFSHCEKEFRDMTVEFHEERVLMAFMSSLASTYKLVFSRRATSLTTKEKLLVLGPRKSVKGDSQVQLWRDGNTIRLASRWSDRITDRWLTMTIPPSEPSRAGNLVSFPPSSYSRGMVLNMTKIASGAAKNQNREHKTGPITITFPHLKGTPSFA
ncbi:similar to An02g05140 [Aspergillus luchuensis]|uniref:Similar to An02g05140 n=1 Tax=Aspergillus kawachii TaxID=1069201 RepID=A0A146FNQ4_ASPKA|nr:similar to An02g05140 [Aspergillus luchuensis]